MAYKKLAQNAVLFYAYKLRDLAEHVLRYITKFIPEYSENLEQQNFVQNSNCMIDYLILFSYEKALARYVRRIRETT